MTGRAKFLSKNSSSESPKVQIKVCGLTRIEDVKGVAQCDVDAVGFVFYQPSARNVEYQQARRLRLALPESIAAVAVVVDPTDEIMTNIVKTVKPDFIQFHGDESPSFCDAAGLPYIKAVRVRQSFQILQASQSFKNASALLLDSYVPQKVGGTGVTFSWDLVPNIQTPLILAGGLNKVNVAAGITHLNPFAVDVSTGVEISPGIKNVTAVEDFVRVVRNLDHKRAVAQ